MWYGIKSCSFHSNKRAHLQTLLHLKDCSASLVCTVILWIQILYLCNSVSCRTSIFKRRFRRSMLQGSIRQRCVLRWFLCVLHIADYLSESNKLVRFGGVQQFPQFTHFLPTNIPVLENTYFQDRIKHCRAMFSLSIKRQVYWKPGDHFRIQAVMTPEEDLTQAEQACRRTALLEQFYFMDYSFWIHTTW